MKIKQTVKTFVVGALLLVAGAFVVTPTNTVSADCGGASTSLINCNQTGGGTKPEDTGVWALLLLAINILTAGVGIAAVAGVVYGSVLYASAGGSPDQVKKAIGIITNVVIGVVAYALMFSLLNFIIPGGLFT